MFGFLRTVLALMVMTFHLFVGLFPLGFYAVFGFYTISGYLMTLIMHESYGYTSRGRFLFLGNRFLRLYPQYWVAATISIVLILAIDPDLVTKYHESIFMPSSWRDAFSNIFMIFPAWHPNEVSPRLVPPTWALTVEIFFYVLICFGISQTFNRVKIWLLFSVAYVIFSFIIGLPRADRYFPVLAASLPFSIGAAIFFVSKSHKIHSCYTRLLLRSPHLFALMLINCFIWMILARNKNIGIFIEIGFYVNQVVCAWLVYSMVCGSQIIHLKKSMDKYIGDFSYPIYLLHWPIGLLVSFLLYGEGLHEFSLRGLICLMLSMVLIFILSNLLIIGIDKPIHRIREGLKARAH